MEDQLSLYFDGVCWDMFPSIHLLKTYTFNRQENETHEEFYHRVFAICDEMNQQIVIVLKKRIDTLERLLAIAQNS